MSRYVDIEGDWVDDAVKAYSLGYYDDDEYAIPFEALGSAPSIDIVRCKECKYREKCEQIVVFDIGENQVEGRKIDFCSYGERIEE